VQTHVIEAGETVTLEGVVVTSPLTAANTGFFIADATGGPNSGVWVYAPFVEGLLVEPGQKINITGVVSEYGASEEVGGDTGEASAPEMPDTETQTQLAISSADDIERVGITEVPPATLVGAATLADPEMAEAYEGVLVRFDATSVTSPYQGGSFGVDGGASVGSIFIPVDFVRMGDTFEDVVGLIYFQDGSYTVQPRTAEDLVGYADTCGSCDADRCVGDLGYGDVAISELMVDPDAGSDYNGEYIEVLNNTAGSVDLNCMSLTDGSDHLAYVEANTVVPAGGLAVLTRRSEDGSTYSGAISASGAATADYRKAVSLNNDFDALSIGFGDVVFDTVTYDATFPYGTGVAMELSADLFGESAADANDSVESWCAAVSEIEGSTDYGTPGTSGPMCGSILTK
jgi:hypothetical protein